MEFTVKRFDELDLETLYSILRLRVDVFVVEQSCPYPEIDGNDFEALHVYAAEGDDIAVYCRILPKGTTFPKAAIGRVVVNPKYREKGLGREIMEYAMTYIKDTIREDCIMLSGQSYLKAFYESLGYRAVSEEYLEDGIPHYDMMYEG